MQRICMVVISRQVKQIQMKEFLYQRVGKGKVVRIRAGEISNTRLVKFQVFLLSLSQIPNPNKYVCTGRIYISECG